MCRRCYYGKNSIRKFSAGPMPGDVPEELQDLTEIEEMLIAKMFVPQIINRCIAW